MENFQPSGRQDQNRGDWKRNRFDGKKSNWAFQFDQELWDGPNLENQRQNSRGGFRRGGRSGGEFNARRMRDYPPVKERYTVKSEAKIPSLMSIDSSLEPALLS